MDGVVVDALLLLQLLVLLFLALHDWIPLGRLNDVQAVKAADSPARLITITALSAAPSAVGLAGSLVYLGRPYPTWLLVWLWLTFAGLLVGQIRAWWVPYLFVPEPARAARYQAMFARTHAFLPVRNGIRPNTLHLILTAALLVGVVLLAVLTIGGGA